MQYCLVIFIAFVFPFANGDFLNQITNTLENVVDFVEKTLENECKFNCPFGKMNINCFIVVL